MVHQLERTYDVMPTEYFGSISIGRPSASLALSNRTVAKTCEKAAHNALSAENLPGHILWDA